MKPQITAKIKRLSVKLLSLKLLFISSSSKNTSTLKTRKEGMFLKSKVFQALSL